MSVSLLDRKINPQVAHMLPEDVMRGFKAFPLGLSGNVLEVAMLDPHDLEALDEIKLLTGCEILPVAASEKDLLAAFDKHFSVQESTKQALIDMRMEGLKTSSKKVIAQVSGLDDVDQKPVVKLMNSIIFGAVTAGASDIHLEPQDPEMRVRYRIDGVLHDVMSIPKHIEPSLVSRAKIISNMDISEKRRSQDGHLSLAFQGKSYDIRLSSMLTISGEKLVLRILDKSAMLVGLDQLGLSTGDVQVVKALIARPYGMIFVTGPTGSGKTTTLYSILNQLDSGTRNIVTIEDPVEYKLAGINQTQVLPQIGITFANGLRTILRQDPEIIMVGEVRDVETAEIAVQAALTGHLVLSTLHTNDAPSAITRLLDMGIEPFMISSTLIGVVAQRLARTICKECGGKGCASCYQSGMKGRIGIMEIMQVSEGIKKLILGKASSTDVRKEAVASGMKTLEMSGLEKIKQGICTKEEVSRVVYSQ